MRDPLPSDHDDHHGGDVRSPAFGYRFRRGLGAASAPRSGGGRTAHPFTIAHALYHPRDLPDLRETAGPYYVPAQKADQPAFESRRRARSRVRALSFSSKFPLIYRTEQTQSA